MMTATEFATLVRLLIPEEVRRASGKILYSAAGTLRQGDIYILGINPGGDPIDLSRHTIDGSLDQLGVGDFNEYVDGCWGKKGPGNGKVQTRLRWLINEFGLDIRAVCASNLVFRRTRSSDDLDYPAEAHQCWPVHRAIIECVQPRMILSIGTGARSPYAYIRKYIAGDTAGAEELFESGHGDWNFKHFALSMNGVTTHVLGMPHLSYYKVTGRDSVAHRCREIVQRTRESL